MPRHIGTRRIHLDVTDSTNTRAAELAFDPANAGTVITADMQSQGRGQHGRIWHSPPGTNVLLSALLFPPPALRRPPVLTALASVVVAETVLQVIAKQSTIKWPNDVLLGAKKVCGILIESGFGARSKCEGGTVALASASGSPGVRPHYIVGIGLNVNQSADDFGRMDLPDATSLSLAEGKPLDVCGITELLIQNLDENYGRLLAGEIAALEECWAWRLGKVGELVTVELTDANEVRGRLRRVTFDRVELELRSGEVRSFRPEEVRHLR
jgi:BirA family biotin operon repressor/biotin-[acetyl-CoA-carboxylase] ligase